MKQKKRPSFNPLIIHVSDVHQLPQIVKFENSITEKIIENFWPGPLTLVLEKTDQVPNIISAGNPTVAVRMPSHKIALELIYKAGTPIAAPSANEFGKLSPTEAIHVEKQLGEKVDIILDGGPCEVGVESTIIQISGTEVSLLRHGGLPVEEVEELIGAEVIRRNLPQKPNASWSTAVPLCSKSPHSFY